MPSESILLTISSVPRSSKPPDEEVGYEKELLSCHRPIKVDANEFMEIVGNRGHSFFPSRHNCLTVAGYLKDGTYIDGTQLTESQILTVDIDNKGLRDGEIIYPYNAIQILKELGLECTGIYQTFNDPIDRDASQIYKLQNCTRYRMVFFLSDPIKGCEKYDYCLKALYKLIPTADSIGAGAIYFGGKGIIYENPEYKLSLPDLDMAVIGVTAISNCIHPESIKKRIRKAIDGIPVDKALTGKISKAKPYRIQDWEEKLVEESSLVRDFVSGTVKIWHRELLGLFLTYRKFMGGEKRWRQLIQSNDLIDGIKIYTIGYQISQWEKKTGIIYNEMNLINFARQDPATSKFYKLSDIIFRRGRPAQRVKSPKNLQKTYTIKEARLNLQLLFKNILSKWDDKVSVLKIATGVGKSSVVAKCQYLAECIIALPRHDLIAELSKEFSINGIEHFVIPELPDLPIEIEEIYTSYLQLGAHRKAIGYLRSIINKAPNEFNIPIPEAVTLQQNLQEYFSALEQAQSETIPILCTHKRLLHCEFPNHGTVIIDEDITETLIEVKSIKISSIRKAMAMLDRQKHRKIIAACKRLITHSQDPANLGAEFDLCTDIGEQLQSEEIETRTIKKLIRIGITDDFLTLFSASKFTIEPLNYNNIDGEKQACYLTYHKIPSNKRLIFLSATASEFIYRRLFPEVQFYEITNIEIRGQLLQFSNRSFSRSSFKNDTTVDLAKHISKTIVETSVISFKGEKYTQHFRNPFRHFDNLSGTNEIAGNDLVIVGTPNKPNYFYRLWSSFLGIIYSSEDCKVEERIVKRNGFRFNFMTFSHPELQEIQFHFIESTLQQAIGRARPHQNDVCVYIFSSYPIQGVEQYHTDHFNELYNQLFFLKYYWGSIGYFC